MIPLTKVTCSNEAKASPTHIRAVHLEHRSRLRTTRLKWLTLFQSRFRFLPPCQVIASRASGPTVDARTPDWRMNVPNMQSVVQPRSVYRCHLSHSSIAITSPVGSCLQLQRNGCTSIDGRYDSQKDGSLRGMEHITSSGIQDTASLSVSCSTLPTATTAISDPQQHNPSRFGCSNSNVTKFGCIWLEETFVQDVCCPGCVCLLD